MGDTVYSILGSIVETVPPHEAALLTIAWELDDDDVELRKNSVFARSASPAEIGKEETAQVPQGLAA